MNFTLSSRCCLNLYQAGYVSRELKSIAPERKVCMLLDAKLP